MKYRILAAIPALAAVLLAQQSVQDASTWTLDASGHRVESQRFSVIVSAAGNQRVESARTLNGRTVPVQSTEDRLVSQDSKTKVIERLVRRYDANGNPGPPTKVRIEETRNPDGTIVTKSAAYEADMNGNMQLVERSTTEVRRGEATETSTTVERASANGALETVERTRSVEKPVGGGSQLDSTTYRRDVSGNFTPFSQDVKRITKNGAEVAVDTSHFERAPDGKIELISRAIDRVRSAADGSLVGDTDVYSRFTAGKSGDVNASEPRLQEQQHRERKVGAGGVVTEVISVRARLPNDPSRFGAYETTSKVTYTSTDAAGKEVKSTETTVGRRDTNGQVVTEQGRSERTVGVKKVETKQ